MFEISFMVIASEAHAEIAKAGIAPGARLSLDLFCRLSHAIRSVDSSMAGLTDASLKAIGQERRAGLALPHFQAVARAVAVSDVVAVVPEHAAIAAMRELRALFAPPFDIEGGPARMYWDTSGLTTGVFPTIRQEVHLKEEKTTPLGQRMIGDMDICGLYEKTQKARMFGPNPNTASQWSSTA